MKHVSRKVIAVGLVAAVARARRRRRRRDGRHAHKKASIQVCVLLPDTSSSVRWVQFDAPDIEGTQGGRRHHSITNALNDPQKQKAQAARVWPPARRWSSRP